MVSKFILDPTRVESNVASNTVQMIMDHISEKCSCEIEIGTQRPVKLYVNDLSQWLGSLTSIVNIKGVTFDYDNSKAVYCGIIYGPGEKEPEESNLKITIK